MCDEYAQWPAHSTRLPQLPQFPNRTKLKIRWSSQEKSVMLQFDVFAIVHEFRGGSGWFADAFPYSTDYVEVAEE